MIQEIKQKPKEKIGVETNRTLVVGDVHGSYLGLLEVLEKSNFMAGEDKIIFLGDLVDGYPDSFEVVDFVRQLPNAIHIRGNHDKWCQDWIETGIATKLWIDQGGKSTLNSYSKYLQRYPKLLEEHLKFFRTQHLYHIDDKNRLFIHAGFDPFRSLFENKKFHGEQIFYWDRELFNIAYNKHYGKSKLSFLVTQEMFSEIFIGHTTTLSPPYKSEKPLNYLNVWNLDTGAGWGGKLTIMDIETKEFWQSDYSKNLYPKNIPR